MKLRSVREGANGYISPVSDFENMHNGFPVCGRHDTNDKGHESLSRPMTYLPVSMTRSVTRLSNGWLNKMMNILSKAVDTNNQNKPDPSRKQLWDKWQIIHVSELDSYAKHELNSATEADSLHA